MCPLTPNFFHWWAMTWSLLGFTVIVLSGWISWPHWNEVICAWVGTSSQVIPSRVSAEWLKRQKGSARSSFPCLERTTVVLQAEVIHITNIWSLPFLYHSTEIVGNLHSWKFIFHFLSYTSHPVSEKCTWTVSPHLCFDVCLAAWKSEEKQKNKRPHKSLEIPKFRVFFFCYKEEHL